MSGTRHIPWLAMLLAAVNCGTPGRGVAPRAAESRPLRVGAPALHSLAEAAEAVKLARYGDAETWLKPLLDEPSTAPEARLWLARLWLARGQYAEAEQGVADLGEGGGPLNLQALLVNAEARWRLGDHDQAIELLTPLTAVDGNHEARRLLGEVLLDCGRRAEAEPVLFRIIEDYNDDRVAVDDGTGLSLVGRAAYLLRSPQDANDAYAEAERVAPKDLRLLLWRAELFLEAHDPDQAARVVQEVLELAPTHPEALALMAHIKLDQALDFDAAEVLGSRALEINPRLPRGHFVLAGIALRDGEIGRAEAVLKRGLALNPEHLELLSLKAAARFLAEDPEAFAKVVQGVLRSNPEYSKLYRIVGTYADWEHRYGDLVELMQQALAVDPQDAKARALLGFNLIRAGREESGVDALRSAFAGDPFDVRVFHTLNLYEKVISSSYETVHDGRFTIRYHRDERALLERYVPGLLQSAWEELSQAHSFEPSTPIGVELYAERRSFAVRTSGLPHTAIQGVCFGETLAAITPRHERFNFGMTLWHELAHVFHIQLSKSRVPRWFTEGLAEHETRLARPEWRREHDRELFEALREKRLPKVALMNRAFTRAERVKDVALAYYASSRIIAGLVESDGRAALTRMLRAWGAGSTGAQVYDQVLGRDADAVDARFRSFLKRELARYQAQFVPVSSERGLGAAEERAKADPENVAAQSDLLRVQLATKQLGAAEKTLKKLGTLADFGKVPELLWLQARLFHERRSADRSEATLKELLRRGHDGVDVRVLLARLAADRGDGAEERTHLERAKELDPSQSAPIVRLAMLANRRGEAEVEIGYLTELALLEQHDASVYRQLLKRLVETGRFEEAAKLGEAAQWVDIHGFETHRLWAEALSQVGESAKALFELESAVLCDASDERIAEAHQQAAGLARRLGLGRKELLHRRLAKKMGAGSRE